MLSENKDTTTDREIPYFPGAARSRERGQDGASRKEITDQIGHMHEQIALKARSVLVGAAAVLESLHEAGHLQHLKKANGVGDVLGAKHLNLPYAMKAGKRFYLLPAIGWDQEMRDAFAALSAEEKVEKVEKLEKELKKIIMAAEVEAAIEASRRSREL